MKRKRMIVMTQRMKMMSEKPKNTEKTIEKEKNKNNVELALNEIIELLKIHDQKIIQLEESSNQKIQEIKEVNTAQSNQPNGMLSLENVTSLLQNLIPLFVQKQDEKPIIPPEVLSFIQLRDNFFNSYLMNKIPQQNHNFQV